MKAPIQAPHAPRPVTVNPDSRLYVIPCNAGYTCHGFDVVERLIAALVAEGRPAPQTPAPIGTPERYAQYRELCNLAELEFRIAGKRSSAELTPELIGKEGKCVEITHTWPSGNRETVCFKVGKSTGWMPIHIQLANVHSNGGPAVCLGKIESVRVIS